MIKIIFTIISIFVSIYPNFILAEDNITELTCYTKFIDDNQSKTNTPIFFAKINFKNDYFYWSDIDKEIYKKEISNQSIQVFAESGVSIRKYVNINRINGSFHYIKPTLKFDRTLAGARSYSGQCEIGIKKKLF